MPRTPKSPRFASARPWSSPVSDEAHVYPAHVLGRYHDCLESELILSSARTPGRCCDGSVSSLAEGRRRLLDTLMWLGCREAKQKGGDWSPCTADQVAALSVLSYYLEGV